MKCTPLIILVVVLGILATEAMAFSFPFESLLGQAKKGKKKPQPKVKLRKDGFVSKKARPVDDDAVDRATSIATGGNGRKQGAVPAKGVSDGLPLVLQGYDPELLCQLVLDGYLYNLSPLWEIGRELNRSFIIEDVRGGQWDAPEVRYTYYVGFCQNTADKPAVCKDKEDAAVYQVDTSGQQCMALGGTRKSWSYQFVDHRRPKSGVAITYENGDECTKRKTTYDKETGTSTEWVTEPRRVVLNVRCDRRKDAFALFEPDNARMAEELFNLGQRATVSEREMCVYTMNLPSIYGCPLDSGDGPIYRLVLLVAKGIWIAILVGAAYVAFRLGMAGGQLRMLLPALMTNDAYAWQRVREIVFSSSKKNRNHSKSW